MSGKITTKIICLANSKKLNDRCVAGIEVDEDSTGYEVIISNNMPKWLRPVSRAEHGEFPTIIAQRITLLDIIQFDIIAPCPSSYQTENVYFAENSVKKISSIEQSSTNLDELTSDTNLLFGNKGKAVHEDVINSLDHSLLFIKANKYNIYFKQGNNQLRMEFSYRSNIYDLPITDIHFMNEFQKNNKILKNVKHLYITLSLAVKQNDWHSKLISGLIYF